MRFKVYDREAFDNGHLDHMTVGAASWREAAREAAKTWSNGDSEEIQMVVEDENGDRTFVYVEVVVKVTYKIVDNYTMGSAPSSEGDNT